MTTILYESRLRDKGDEGLDDLRGVSLGPDFEAPQPPDEGLDDGRAHDAEVCHREDGRPDVIVLPRRGDREGTAHEAIEQRRVDTVTSGHRDEYSRDIAGVEERHHVPHIDKHFTQGG